MKLAIKDYKKFVCSVFGADCFLERWPEIEVQGIVVEKRFDRYYIPETLGGNDTTFFTEKEVQNCMEFKE